MIIDYKIDENFCKKTDAVGVHVCLKKMESAAFDKFQLSFSYCTRDRNRTCMPLSTRT